MNIILFNTHNPFREAGTVSLDLFNHLKGKGHNVRLLVNSYNQYNIEGIISVETQYSYWWKKESEKFEWRLRKIRELLKITGKKSTNPDYSFFQLNEKKLVYKTDILLKKADIKPDVIIVLFAKKFINSRNIYELNQRTKAPIYWLMYDMAPLTGGCHYAWDCKGYQNSCGNCPGLFSNNPCDISYHNLLYKKKYIDKTNIQIIAASEWQYRQAHESSLFRNTTIHKILLSVDSSVFTPHDKRTIRLKLGMPPNRKVIFFGAVVLTQKRKGIAYLLESLKIIKEKTEKSDPELNKNILLLIAGTGINEIAESLPFEFHYLGKIKDANEIATAYQAADVFLCPSIEDSGPMMINQSLMCGTPVVCFEMGVALDLVKTGETGYKAKLKDSNDLAEGLYKILSLDAGKYKKCSENCREIALEMCSPEAQIGKIESMIQKSYGL